MINSFNFIFPTFDSEPEFKEIILDVPSSDQSIKSNKENLMTASLNDMTNFIVSEMMSVVKQDFSMFKDIK